MSSEWTELPVQPQVFQRLLAEMASAWCSDNLPTTALEPASTLPVALAHAFDTTEPLLRLSVKHLLLGLDPVSALVIDAWFQKQGISLPQYLSCISTVESEVDGLFIWLCARAYNQHLNIVHGNGIWCTQHSCIPNLEDAVVILILCSFMASPPMSKVNTHPKSGVKWGLQNFTDRLVPSPFILNHPVKDIHARCNEIGLTWTGDPVPLQQLLAGIMYSSYREDLTDWIMEYKSHLLPVTQWLFAWGLYVLDYVSHLANDGACDGLEVWLVSALSESPINISGRHCLVNCKNGYRFCLPNHHADFVWIWNFV